MRTDPAAFNELNSASVKEPRFVVRVNFSTPILITSHTGITGLSGAVIDGALIEPSIVSQRLNPIEGRSEIGSASFQVADLAGTLTDEIRSRLGAAAGLRDKQVEFFLGYAGLAFADFVRVGTQRVTEATFDKGRYQISCADIQRSAKKDIFELAETTLAQSLSATDTTVTVSSTAGFTTVFHGPTYSDAANATVGYIKIRDEVIRYTGKTATTFTGCVRGVLGTIAAAYDVDAATPAARREKVTEHVYLELPAVKIAYAILTGQLYGDAATLPASWHLGIDTSLIRTSDFTGIGGDLWDGANAGVVIRFEGLKKTDGKKFLEEEICRLLGVFMPVYADGAWGLRRAARVLSDAATVATLDESNSVQVGELVHDMGDLHNVFRIFWNWNGSDYTRTTALIDASSAAAHGKADPLDLKFKGLYGGKATDSLLYQLVDALRDRYAAPPERLSVTVLHSLNRLEVGDVVRVRYASVRDYAGAGASIDRAFEIQNLSVNHKTGAVQLELFGSTSPASALSPTTATTALPNAFYTAAGAALSTVAPITAGVMATGSYTLTGGADLTAAGSIWYHDGDLTIPQGATLNITGNVQLRVRGYLTINGTITGVGGGRAGVADNTSPTLQLTGNPGWVGNSRGLDGIDAQQDYMNGNARLVTVPVPVTQGKHAAFPYLEIAVAGNALTGLPTDLRGTGGGPGGKITSGGKADLRAQGGAGAAGGAGLAVISRGFSTGASATINLSGASPTAPAMHGPLPNKYYPGAGGAGGPGSLLLLLDGSTVSAPDLTNRFIANTGTIPQPAPYLGKLTFLDNEGPHRYDDNEDPWAGYPDPAVISGRSLAGSAQRIQFIPAPETATADPVAAPPAPSGLSAVAQDGFVLVSWTLPADPASYDAVEIFASTTNDRTTAVKVFDGRSSDFKHVLADQVARFYWARSRLERAVSAWHPATTTSSATAAARPPTVTGYLTNEAVAVAADSAGTVASFAGASGSFKVLAGAVDVTTSATFSLFASSNLTATINATTGAYSATAMSADVGTATFRASFGGVTVDKVFSVTKARAGVNGSNGTNGSNGSNGSNGTNAVSISLSRDAVQLFAFAEGTVPSFADAVGTVTVRDGATDVTASATLSALAGAGVTGTVNTATNTPVNGQPKGYYRVTAMTGDTGTLTLSAVYGGVTYQATFTLAKNKTGYEIVGALPSTNLFEGRMVYLTTDDKLYRYTGSAWTTAVPAADISGQLADSQIAAVGAGKVTGQLTNAQIADLAAAKVTGQLADSQIASLGAGKVTGQLTNAQIADIAAAKVTGQLVDSQLAAIAAGKVTGQLVASQLNVGVGGGNLAPNAGFRNHSSGVPSGWAIYNNGAISVTPSVNAGGLFGTNFYRITANAPVTSTLGIYTAAATSGGVNSWTPGVSYVVSFWARANGAGAVGRTMSGLNSNMGFTSATQLAAPQLADGVWQRYAWRVQPASNGQTPAGELYISWEGAPMPSGASIDICAPQVEQGELPSGFSPRPEEILPGTITATEIADNAVTTPKLVAGAVVAGKIAADAVGANEIQANAITTAKLAASAVEADKLAANSVTAGKMVLANPGASLMPDPTFEDESSWAVTWGGTLASFKAISDAPAGRKVAFCPAGSQARSLAWHPGGNGQKSIPVDRTKQYRFSFWWRVASGTSATYSYATVQQRRGDGTLVGGNNGHEWYVWAQPATAAGGWNRAEFTVGAGTIYELHADTKFLAPSFLLNWEAAGGEIQIADVRLDERVASSLIVDGAVIADKIAANAVTAAKISAGAVVAGKIAADAVTANEIAANAITTPKITAGAVVADKIAANAVTAEKITAGAITTSKLLVSGIGSSITDDPNTQDITAWSGGTLAIVNDTTSPTGRALQVTSVGATTSSDRLVSIDATKNYLASVWGKQVSGTPVSYLLIAFYDAANTLLTGSAYPTGWPSSGTFHYFGVTGTVMPAVWTEYKIAFGPNETAKIPAGAAFVRIGFLANYSGAGTAHYTRVSIAEKTSADLIVDGAVIADKIAANAVTAAKISAGAVVAGKIAADAVTANEIAANAITTPKISAGAVVAGKIAADAVTANEIAANAVTTPKLTAGAVVADKIAAGAITATKLAVAMGGANLVRNSSLETGVDGFGLYDNSSEATFFGLQTSGGRTGANFLRVSFNANNSTKGFYLGNIGQHNNAGLFGPGRWFVFSWYARASGSAVGRPMFTAWNVGPDNLIALSNPALTTSWQRYAFAVRWLGASADNNGFASIDGGSNGSVDFDDIQVEEGEYPTGYAPRLAPGEVIGTFIADGAVVTDKLAANAITANKIAAGAVTAAKLSVSSLDAISANVGTLTAGVIRNTADTFRVDVSNGRTTVTTGSYMKVTGAPFGSSSQFIEWYGPYQSNLANCTESNAVYYLKTNGTAYFGGALLAGVLKNSVQGTNLTDANEAILGPFSTNGGNITLTMALNFYGRIDYPGTTTGLNNYNAKTKQNPSFTVVLSRKIGGGSYSDVATYNFTGSWNGEAPVPVDSAPGYYEQEGAGSGTYTDTSGGTADKTFKLRFTSWANVNSTVIANTLSLTSVE